MNSTADPGMSEPVAMRTHEMLQEGNTDVYRKLIQEIEKHLLPAVMNHCHWNQVQAAQVLGLSRMTLRAKLKALQLTNPTHK